MSNVSFTTKGGKKVTFKSSSKRRGKRKLSAYNRFAKRELPKEIAKGKSAKAAMRAVAKAWKEQKA